MELKQLQSLIGSMVQVNVRHGGADYPVQATLKSIVPMNKSFGNQRCIVTINGKDRKLSADKITRLSETKTK